MSLERPSRPRLRQGPPAIVLVGVVLGASLGCDTNAALKQLAEARHLSANLLVHFTKAADAANRAVLADTDEQSEAFANEAAQATAAVEQDADALAPILRDLGYSKEEGLLEEFRARFTEYRALDRTILELAVENTNLKAQRLSFGEAREAADAFRDALEHVAPLDRGRDTWHTRALAATAVASVREIEALEAPHIAEPDDAAMANLEHEMAAAAAVATSALGTLDGLIRPESRLRLAEARAALARLMEVNARIVGLSRRNTNVRSLALTLEHKPAATAACEERIQALREALAKRGVIGSRY